MKMVIRFLLSEKGRKAALLAGLEPKTRQEIEIKKEDEQFKQFVELAEVEEKGASLDTASSVRCRHAEDVQPIEYDEIPTIPTLIADELKRRAEAVNRENQKILEYRDEALAYLAARKPEVTTNSVGFFPNTVNYEKFYLRWPYESPLDVCESEEAKAWEVELEEINNANRALAEKQSEEKKQAAEAEKSRKESAEQERRQSLGLEADDLDIKIQNGALVSAPIWESHKRGKNWFAIIKDDPNSPGGLSRDFAQKAKGEYYYIVPSDLSAGDCVEFGADYYSGSGSKRADRWYGYIKELREDLLILVHCATAKKAFKESVKFLEKATVPAV